MSAIFEPTSASWSIDNNWPTVTIAVNAEDRNIFLRRQYTGGTPDESIELHLKDLPAIEAALLNARLWLERAIRQHDELKAAEEIATDAAEDGPEALVCFLCGHPFHGLKVCDDCGCPRPSMGGS